MAFWFFKTILIPIGMPTMTVLIGWATDLPWFYIWIGFLASLALVFHWLLKMDEWLFRKRVEDKIAFANVRVSPNINGEGLHIGVIVESTADFPINFSVSSFDARFGDRVPKEAYDLAHITTIPSKGVGWYDSPIIKVDHPSGNGVIEGQVKFEMKYGRFNNLKYTISGRKRVMAIYKDGHLINATHSEEFGK